MPSSHEQAESTDQIVMSHEREKQEQEKEQKQLQQTLQNDFDFDNDIDNNNNDNNKSSNHNIRSHHSPLPSMYYPSSASSSSAAATITTTTTARSSSLSPIVSSSTILVLTGTLSLIGSYVILRELYADYRNSTNHSRRRKRKRTSGSSRTTGTTSPTSAISPTKSSRSSGTFSSSSPSSEHNSSSSDSSSNGNSISNSSIASPIVRVLIYMSLADILYSFSWILGTSTSPPLPPPSYYSSTNTDMDIHLDVAAFFPCTIQGFLQQFGLISLPLYTVTLCLLFLLLIDYNGIYRKFTGSKKTSNTYCSLVYAIEIGIFLVTIVCCIFPIPLQLYNEAFREGVCWIDSYPKGCTTGNCLRGGDHSGKYAIFFTVLPLWPCIFLAITIIGMICISDRNNNMVIIVQQDQNRSKRNSSNSLGDEEDNNDKIIMSSNEKRARYSYGRAAIARPSISIPSEIKTTKTSSTENSSNSSTRSGSTRSSSSGGSDNLIATSDDAPHHNPYLDQSEEMLLSQPGNNNNNNNNAMTNNNSRTAAIMTSNRSSTLSPMTILQTQSQATWYIIAFLVTYVPEAICKMNWYLGHEFNDSFSFIAYNILLPLQGFFNCLVFIKNRQQQYDIVNIILPSPSSPTSLLTSTSTSSSTTMHSEVESQRQEEQEQQQEPTVVIVRKRAKQMKTIEGRIFQSFFFCKCKSVFFDKNQQKLLRRRGQEGENDKFLNEYDENEDDDDDDIDLDDFDFGIDDNDDDDDDSVDRLLEDDNDDNLLDDVDLNDNKNHSNSANNNTVSAGRYQTTPIKNEFSFDRSEHSYNQFKTDSNNIMFTTPSPRNNHNHPATQDYFTSLIL